MKRKQRETKKNNISFVMSKKKNLNISSEKKNKKLKKILDIKHKHKKHE